MIIVDRSKLINKLIVHVACLNYLKYNTLTVHICNGFLFGVI